jgi:hypothetical protein
MVMGLIEEHVTVTAEERMAVALWILHAWVFDQFSITPRLVILSPVSGCGKSTLLTLIKLLVPRPEHSDNTTAPAIYHALDQNPGATLLLDEGDNLGLFRNDVLRSVFNSGHRRGGSIDRFIGRGRRKFGTFAPLVIAAIGTLPRPLLHRSIEIRMHRQPHDSQIRRLDENDTGFMVARDNIQKWAGTATLNRDPEMPQSLRDRAADNFRALLAIADDLGYPEQARSMAIQACSNRLDEDIAVTLLIDVRQIFSERGIVAISSEILVKALHAVDHGLWSEWRGQDDRQLPHKLTQNELAALLHPFRIRPKTIWPKQRRPGDRSKRGYMRSWFVQAWRSYCPPDDTPPQASNIRHLHSI